MNKPFISLFVSLFSFTKIIAQDNLPAVYEIKSDTAFQQNLDDSYWQLLEDTIGRWTIQQVSAPPLSYKFGDSLSKIQHIDTSISTFWFRYRLKNVMNHEAKIALDSHSEQDDFYVLKAGGKWEHFVTGFLYPWNKKDGFKRGNYIPVILQAGEELIVYIRSHSRSQGLHYRLPVSFVNTAKEIEKEFYDAFNVKREHYFSMNEILEAFIVGFLFISFFFNLFFYSIVREKVYLYFALFLFFLSINRLSNIFSIYTRWVHPSINEYVAYLGFAWMFILMFLVLFIRHFFQTFKRFPVWDKFLVGLIVLAILSNLIELGFTLYSARTLYVLDLIIYLPLHGIPFCLLITLFLFIRKPDRFQRLVIIGAAPLMFFYGVIGTLLTLGQEKVIAWLSGFENWVDDNFRSIEVICIIWLVIFFSLVLFLRYNQLRKEHAQQALDKERLEKEKEMERNQLIAQQKIDLEHQVAERTSELKQSLEELKSAQAQLIQSEKMASLGELTAGIAHEIQNPLNFVNNFSEVNTELITEMNEEIDKGNIQEVKAIANDIAENEQKINHHGKRADAIVKGMLQHSRSSNGVKEPTDINALADEYFRLAYHGLRAKDKSFNATMQSDFDESLETVKVVPQDMGRAILNLFTNAFYAVTEKEKQMTANYEPTVMVSTRKINEKVEIRVKDNGNGIPQKVLDKIFQPFFTTKPTGQGTGLGLSLSYDIVKAHGGEIKVSTVEYEGTEFIIQLPI